MPGQPVLFKEKRHCFEVLAQESGKEWFYINAFPNHYPDFILLAEKGTVVLLETKGEQLDGSDSQSKIRAGQAWENAANQPDDERKYEYSMVFETGKLDGAYSVEEMLDRLGNWQMQITLSIELAVCMFECRQMRSFPFADCSSHSSWS